MAISVIENINMLFEELFPAEKKVAQYILDNAKDIITMNVSELAKNSKTSDATVIRAIKHLGYDGYYQMRLLLSGDIAKSELISENEDALSAAQKFFAIEAERINRLATTIDLPQLIEVAKVVMESKYTHIIAVGNTTPISADLGFRLERAGIRCSYSTLYEQFINHINLGNKDECVIAISRSGASKQIIQAVEIAKKRKMKVIAITGELREDLIKNATYVIKINEMKSRISTFGKPHSHLPEMAINDVLLYVIKNIQKANDPSLQDLDDKDEIGNLISEFKL